MRRVVLLTLFLSLSPSVFAADAAITRRDAFIMLWASIKRPAVESKGAWYNDVPAGSPGALEINYAKRRQILENTENFHPNDPLMLHDALIWMFRTRNVASPDEISEDTLLAYLEKYPVGSFIEKDPDHPGETRVLQKTLTEAEFASLIQKFDQLLREEVHEISFYAENFHGKGTAFGEPFDMYAMTAAHKTFPANTMVKVTNVTNGKSVIVRINDRGPFVPGRDMDLSLAAFNLISNRSKGKDRATFERLGDASLVASSTNTNSTSSCGKEGDMQVRLPGRVLLTQGVPEFLEFGGTLTLSAKNSFVVREMKTPSGEVQSVQDWVLPGETYTFTPSVEGTYRFRIGNRRGQMKWMAMEVGRCS